MRLHKAKAVLYSFHYIAVQRVCERQQRRLSCVPSIIWLYVALRDGADFALCLVCIDKITCLCYIVIMPAHTRAWALLNSKKKKKTKNRREKMENLVRFLIAQVPVLIWGDPGIGKTAMILSLAMKLRMAVRVLVASWMAPQDFGFPVLSEDVVKLSDRTYKVIDLVPPRVALDLATTRGILFLDELTSTPPELQAPLLSLFMGHRFGELQLDPRNTAIVAAANPVQIAANGWQLSLPLKNRVAHLRFTPDLPAFIADFPNYWGHPPTLGFAGVGEIADRDWAIARSKIAGFLKARPELFHVLPESEDQTAFPTARSWDYASRLLAVGGGVDEVAAVVGDGAAAELFAWLDAADLPDPDDLLAGRASFIVDEKRPDRVFAVLSAISTRIPAIADKEAFNAAVAIFTQVARSSLRDVAFVSAQPLFQFFRDNREKLGLQMPHELLALFVRSVKND